MLLPKRAVALCTLLLTGIALVQGEQPAHHEDGLRAFVRLPFRDTTRAESYECERVLLPKSDGLYLTGIHPVVNLSQHHHIQLFGVSPSWLLMGASKCVSREAAGLPCHHMYGLNFPHSAVPRYPGIAFTDARCLGRCNCRLQAALTSRSSQYAQMSMGEKLGGYS